MKVLVVIPARYGSTRFPAKVVAKDTGKFLVQHTYERALYANSVEDVLVATDDDRVMAACKSFDGRCVMTSADHQSGTDRIAEAVSDIDADIIVNLQADEPEIDPANIDYLIDLLDGDKDAVMATLVAGFDNAEQVTDPNVVKCVTDVGGRAIYFSRSPIPYARDEGGIGDYKIYRRHLGIYAYRKDFLMKITKHPQTQLELTEKLEQLRVIENGYSIITGKVEQSWTGIDTPEQYADFVKRMRQ